MNNNILIPCDDYLFERAIGKVVERNGCYVSLGMTPEAHIASSKITEKFIQEYNPDGLSREEYKTARLEARLRGQR